MMDNLKDESLPHDAPEDFSTLILINQIIYRGYFLILILAGTCGNLLTAITLLRAKLRKYQVCQLMAVWALLNTGVLLTHTLNMLLSQGYDIHVLSAFELGWCRINTFVAKWISHMASWILVLIAFDGCQQSKFVQLPPKNNNYTILIRICITGLILLILNLHYLLFTGSQVALFDDTFFLACIFHKYSSDPIQRFFASTSPWQELIAVVIVPFILILILNIFTIKNSFVNARSNGRPTHGMAMLLVSNIAFLALVAPARFFYTLLFDHHDLESIDQYKSFVMQGNIYQCFVNTYYAASFIFCFASSSVFRHEVRKLFHKDINQNMQ